MKSFRLLLFLIPLALVISCQNQNSKSDSEGGPVSPNQERLSSLKKGKDSGNIPAQRAQALSILNHRMKNNPESYAIIEADVWEYQFVFDGEMSEKGEYAGIWIDFKPDFTYEYGKLTEVRGSGKYNYHFERSELLMVDNLPSAKPQEWSVKNAGDAMVLVGTALYGDNSVQMKLQRVPDSIRQ